MEQRTRHVPAGFQWCPGCTWRRQKWFPGRSRAPRPHQTPVPVSVRSCSRSHPLPERAKVGPSQSPAAPPALPEVPEGRMGLGQPWTPLQQGAGCSPPGPRAAGAITLAEPFPGSPAARCDGQGDTCPLGCQTGAEAAGTRAMPCSILPEEPLELGGQDQWSCCSRMINSFNYTLRQCCQHRAQPIRAGGPAQLTRSQLPGVCAAGHA